MYVVIVGAGTVGLALARWLIDSDHEVAVIERDPARCSALDEELGGVSLAGDGTEAGTLARAGTNRADLFIATTGRDDENLVACQLARHRLGAARTVSLVNLPEHHRLLNLLGIDVTVDVTGLILGSVQEELSGVLAEEVGSMDE